MCFHLLGARKEAHSFLILPLLMCFCREIILGGKYERTKQPYWQIHAISGTVLYIDQVWHILDEWPVWAAPARPLSTWPLRRWPCTAPASPAPRRCAARPGTTPSSRPRTLSWAPSQSSSRISYQGHRIEQHGWMEDLSANKIGSLAHVLELSLFQPGLYLSKHIRGFHIWRPQWVEGGESPKSRWKKQNQLISDMGGRG